MKVSLKELFAITAFCGVVAWGASYAGVTNALFPFSMVMSAIMSGVFVFLMSRKVHYRVASVVCVLPLGMCCAVGGFAGFINAAGLLVAGIACCRTEVHVRTLIGITMLCWAIGIGAGVASTIPGIRELETARAEFPAVSLGDRLAYEAGSSGTSYSDLGTKVRAQLGQDEDIERPWRRRALRRLHSRYTDQFVRASGFGILRMAPPGKVDGLHRPALRDIAFGETEFPEYSGYGSVWQAYMEVPPPKLVEDLHLTSRRDFLDPDGFGYSVEKRKVVGFVEHAFHFPLQDASDQLKWRLDRLELVSLLKFAEPRVYVLDHLPRMDQLSADDVPTRTLDSFEADALQKLRTQEDLVVGHDGDACRMLGSLRAARQCLECHNVDRGQLLGAFSYRLTRL